MSFIFVIKFLKLAIVDGFILGYFRKLDVLYII